MSSLMNYRVVRTWVEHEVGSMDINIKLYKLRKIAINSGLKKKYTTTIA